MENPKNKIIKIKQTKIQNYPEEKMTTGTIKPHLEAATNFSPINSNNTLNSLIMLLLCAVCMFYTIAPDANCYS